MIALLLPHTGAHAAQHTPLLACLPPFFRRAVAAVRRKLAVPAALDTAGTATPTTLLAAPGHDLLTDADLTALRTRRARQHADAMHAGYAAAVDRLRQEAGLPTVKQMRELRAGSPPFLFPPLEEPLWAEPQARGPVRDTRMDVAAPHYAPDTAPGYGQAPVLVVDEAQELQEAMLP